MIKDLKIFFINNNKKFEITIILIDNYEKRFKFLNFYLINVKKSLNFL